MISSSSEEKDFAEIIAFNEQFPRVIISDTDDTFDIVLDEISAVESGKKLISWQTVPLIDSLGQELMDFLLEIDTFLSADCFFISPCSRVIFYNSENKLSVIAKKLFVDISYQRYDKKVLTVIESWNLFGILAGYSKHQICEFINNSSYLL